VAVFIYSHIYSHIQYHSLAIRRWLEENIPQGLTVMSFPIEHQRRLRTTNLSERVDRE
jgi:transposase-like protein